MFMTIVEIVPQYQAEIVWKTFCEIQIINLKYIWK